MRHLLQAFLLFGALTAVAQTADDAIVISDATDQYWPQTEADGSVSFHNKVQTTFLAERMGGQVQADIYYGNTIQLDGSYAGLGNIAGHTTIEPHGVVFDDSRLCFYHLNLARQGKKATARFERTFTDSRFFNCVMLADERLIRHKQVKLTLPKGYHVLEHNMNDHISRSNYTDKQGRTVYCYTLTDQPAMRQEPLMPPVLKTSPCLLVLGAFQDVHDLYRWLHGLSAVDCSVPQADSLLRVISAGCTTSRQRAQATLQWVQQHISYVAYEAGLASHQPDTPAEVLRKRHGDCKGKALLLSTLLQAQGLDAHLTYIGTADIPWTPSEVPALAAINHAVCTLFLDGDTLLLDPTARHLPLGCVPTVLQGREALVEQGDTCLRYSVPMQAAPVDSLHYDVTLSGQQLHIQATAAWSGDVKELVLSTYDDTPTKDKAALAARWLNADDRHRQVDSCTWTATGNAAPWATLSGTLTDTKAVMAMGSELYVELEPHNDLFALPIDTTRRTNDAELPFRCRIVRQVELLVPQGYHVSSLPQGISLTTAQGVLSCSFTGQCGRVVMRKVMTLEQPLIRRQDIDAWNNALRRWHDASSELVVLKKDD